MLTITYIPVIDEGFANRLREEAHRIDPQSKVEGRDPGPQGAIEWALPAVVAFVLGGVANAVLGELGKDAYKGLKKLISDAYEEACRSPHDWHVNRREPTLETPQDAEEPQTGAATQNRITSPPLKVTLQIEDWGGQLGFVFSDDFSPEQLAEAFEAIGQTTQTILDYCEYLYAELRSKRSRPQLYQGTMPDSIWEERMQYEIHEASRLLHSVFVFDTEAKVWGRVH